MKNGSHLSLAQTTSVIVFDSVRIACDTEQSMQAPWSI